MFGLRFSLKSTLYLLMFLITSLRAQAHSQWTQRPFPATENLSKVRFVNQSTGWILGNRYIYKTSNGGGTWVIQDSSRGPHTALHALNSNIVFYAAGHGIRRSTDGGANWQIVDTPSFYYTDFEFIDSQTGSAVGGNWGLTGPIVRKTTDGGADMVHPLDRSAEL